MPNPSPDPSVVRFGEYEFDLRSGELASGERKILLADQPFRLLVLLVRARGQLVSREELRRELWSDDTFVDFELSLNAAVRRLRETLGDSASSPRFIQTLPRRGYRFIAEVNGTGASAASPTGAARASDAMQSAPEHAAAKGVAAGTRVRALATGGLVLAMLGFLAMRVWPLRTESAPTHPAARVKPLTQDGSVRLAALSPDGGAVAYVRASGTRESLWLGPISALPGSQIVGPAEGTFRSLSFGPDGFIYYTFFQPDRTVVALYRVYARGGEPSIVHETAGGVAFSPDGTRLAHVSSFSMPLRESRVVVADVSGGNQRMVAVRTPPRSYGRHKPAWSPDGSRLAVVGIDDRRPAARELLVVDVRSGTEHPVVTLDVSAIEGVQWLPGADPNRLIVSMREARGLPLRLWEVSVETGQRRPLTFDRGDHALVGLSRDGHGAIAVRTETSWSLWAAPLANVSTGARRLATGAGTFELLEGVAWTPQGEIVYVSNESGNLDLWRIDPETETRARMTFDSADDFHPAVSPDGRMVAFASTRSGNSAIWATAVDAERPRRLTSGDDRWPSWSPDGRWVAFQRGFGDTAIEAVWRVRLDDSEPDRVGPTHSYRPVVSPDAKLIAHYWMNPERWALAITPVGRDLPIHALPIARTHGKRVVRWSRDGTALVYIDSAGGAANIWVQPVAGGPPQRLTDFREGTIETFDWSHDDLRLAWLRVTQEGNLVELAIDN